MKSNILHRDFLLMLLLYMIIIILKIIKFQALTTIFIIILSILTIYSNNVIFWFTFSFIYSNSPAGLFDTYTFGLKTGNITIDFTFFLLFSLILKVIQQKPQLPIYFKNTLYLVGIIIIINIIRGIVAGFDNVNVFFRIFKVVFPFLWIFVSFRVFRTEEDFDYFFKLIFPFVFVSFFAQIFIYIYGKTLAYVIFGEEFSALDLIIDPEIRLSRYVFSVFLLTTAFLGSLFYISMEIKVFNLTYLYAILFTILLSYFISGTRSWTISFFIIFVVSILFIIRKYQKILYFISFILIFIYLTVNYIPYFQVQSKMAYERIMTVELLLEGDITAGGTSGRFDVVPEKLLKLYNMTNPLFGAGYSQFMFENQDAHAGHHNTLFQAGIFGFIFMYFLIISLIIKSLTTYKLINRKWNVASFLFSLILIALLIIQSTVQVFSYVLMPHNGLFYAFILVFGNFAYQMVKSNESLSFKNPKK